MKTLAVIPARLGATRLPNKPLRLLAGVPLVVRVWQRVIAMQVADKCVIATDDDQVAKVARDAGAEFVMTRADHPSGTDRVAEVVGQRSYRDYDVIVNVQGDEPFISAEAVRGAASIVREGKFPLGTAAVRADISIQQTASVVKVVVADDGRALYFSRAPIPFLRDSADLTQLDGQIRQHLGIYAYSRDALLRWVSLPPHPLERIERLEQLRPLAAGIAMGVATVSEHSARGVDTEEDLLHANERWNAFVREGGS